MADWTFIGHFWSPDQEFRRFAPGLVDASRAVWDRLAHLLGMPDSTPDGLEDMLTTSELAAKLKVPRQVIYDLRHAGDGPRGVHVGKELRFRISENAWLDRRSDPIAGEVRDAR